MSTFDGKGMEKIQSDAFRDKEGIGNDTINKKKRTKNKKKRSLQIKGAARSRPVRSNINITNRSVSLDEDLSSLRWLVMALNAISCPLTSFMGLAVHIMALLGALQLELSLLRTSSKSSSWVSVQGCGPGLDELLTLNLSFKQEPEPFLN